MSGFAVPDCTGCDLKVAEGMLSRLPQLLANKPF